MNHVGCAPGLVNPWEETVPARPGSSGVCQQDTLNPVRLSTAGRDPSRRSVGRGGASRHPKLCRHTSQRHRALEMQGSRNHKCYRGATAWKPWVLGVRGIFPGPGPGGNMDRLLALGSGPNSRPVARASQGPWPVPLPKYCCYSNPGA